MTAKATKSAAAKKPAAAEKDGSDHVEGPAVDEYDRAADEALLTPEVRLARLEKVVAGLCGGQDRFESAAAS